VLRHEEEQPAALAPGPTEPSGVSTSNRPWLRIGLMVGLVALAARIFFVASLAAADNGAGLNDNAGDARQYIALARNLAEFGTFIDDSTGGRQAGSTYFSMLRPPIYPALAAPFEAREARAALFYLQAIIGSAIPMFTAFLAGIWFQSRPAAWLAGLMAAFSPTGIGLAGQVMADQLFATLFAASIVAVALSVRSSRHASRWMWIAGIACGLATLVKPAGLYWPFVLPVLTWILAQAASSQMQWRAVAAAVALGLILPAMWAVRNYRVAGVFAVSTVDAQNLRYYLAPQAEEWASADDIPTKAKLKKNRERTMRRDIDDTETLSPRDIVRRQWSESVAIFREHPAETFQAYLHNLRGHLTTPFNGFDYQFPNGGMTRRVMGRLEEVTGSTAAYWVIGVLSAASLLPLLVRTNRRDPTWRMRVISVAAIVLIFGYVAGLSGTTYGTGSRILFPAHIAVQLLMAAGVAALQRDLPRILRREPIASHAA
jgi:4-amino-4-deoxy-L-arabinose transferase-like glycosyltransferase